MNKPIRSNKELGETLRRVRIKKKMRQIDVANKASVRQALISDLEAGITTAKIDTVIKVLSALDVDLSIIPRCNTEFDPTEY